MKTKNIRERGQAIVLIAIGIVALVGFTGLAIDSGNAFSDRRRAQNAADTAVVSAALAKTRGNFDWANTGLTMASNNGYDNTNANHDVFIHTCDAPLVGISCPAPYDGEEEYLHIVIQSKVNTFFAPVVGVSTLTNNVEAIARAKPSQEMYEGNAVVATCSSGSKTGDTGGAAGVDINGGGLFINSDDTTSACAFADNGAAGGLYLDYPISVVGCAANVPGDLTVNTGAEQAPTKDYTWVMNQLGCTGAPENAYTIDSGTKTMTLTSSPTVITASNFPPANVEVLGAGIYCLEGNFRVTASNAVLSGDDVTFVMLNGGVTINGGDIQLSAPESGPLPNLLFYQPQENTSSSDSFSFSGNAGADSALYLDGMILAPGNQININGGSNTVIDSQIVGCKFSISGSAGTVINYNDDNNVNDPPQIELIQ